jgi:hypothetical protein
MITIPSKKKKILPGDLREKIQVWEVLNKILKNIGFIDADAITNDLSNLKIKINSLINEVLGVGHDIDGIHNYDDNSIKDSIQQLTNKFNQLTTDVSNDLTIVLSKLNGITSLSSKLSLENASNIELLTLNDSNSGSRVLLSQQQLILQTRGDGSNIHGMITIGDGTVNGGINIATDQNINISHSNLQHFIEINSNALNVSDINNVVITSNQSGVTFSLYNDSTKKVTIPWVT